VFFALRPQSAVLSDHHRWLVDPYRAVRHGWRKVSAALDGLPNTKTAYYALRAEDPGDLPLHERGARLIYLNKTGFRGLYRVNQAGRFNVPYGAYDRRTHVPEHLQAASRALRGVDLRCGDFEAGLAGVGRRDFVYLDPPYVKLGGYSDFNRYTEGRFERPDHERLATILSDLDRAGVRWLLSQSDTPLVRRLFRTFRVERIQARREINLTAARRNVSEVLVSNY